MEGDTVYWGDQRLGTATLNVDSTGLGGQRITATLTADDGSADPACAQTVQAVSVIAPIEKKKVIVAREFDESTTAPLMIRKRGSTISPSNCKTIRRLVVTSWRTVDE